MLAAGIARTRLLEKLYKVKEAKRRLLEATSTATCTGTLTAQAKKYSVSYLLNLIRKTLNAHMRIRNRRTYIYISNFHKHD